MQCKKANWRVVRDRIPCSRCCSESHATRNCGKTNKQIEQDRRSRERNPQDPINKQLIVTGSRVSKCDLSIDADENWRETRQARNEAREQLEERRLNTFVLE